MQTANSTVHTSGLPRAIPGYVVIAEEKHGRTIITQQTAGHMEADTVADFQRSKVEFSPAANRILQALRHQFYQDHVGGMLYSVNFELVCKSLEDFDLHTGTIAISGGLKRGDMVHVYQVPELQRVVGFLQNGRQRLVHTAPVDEPDPTRAAIRGHLASPRYVFPAQVRA